ncbi:MAG: hypothetical protein V3U02_06630 [Calditrichia bacterium]
MKISETHHTAKTKYGTITKKNPRKVKPLWARTIRIEDIQRLNEQKGKHFFDKDARRFFGSRIASEAYLTQNSRNAYFVTSEQFDRNQPRLYSVRVANTKTGTIDTVGRFQGFSNSGSAKREAIRLSSR